jgi:hypothetical protein
MKEERDTERCVPNFPHIQCGQGFISQAPALTDIDMIGSDNWDSVMLYGEDDSGSFYVGQTYVHSVYCHVWWNETENCFLAQVALN